MIPITSCVDSHNRQKKVAVINDLSGFGRCSLTVSLPVISACGLQCCPVPTALLSNHTGYPSYSFLDCTDQIGLFTNEWRKLGLKFEGISTGYLGSPDQFAPVHAFFDAFGDGAVKVVDPVMGDDGELYPGYTDEMPRLMKELVCRADVLTPNLTEACFLTDTPFRDSGQSDTELYALTDRLFELGPQNIVITGIHRNGQICNACRSQNGELYTICTPRYGGHRAGTGDVFASLITAYAVRGVPLGDAVKHTTAFVTRCIIRSIELGLHPQDGVCFEEFLHTLKN